MSTGNGIYSIAVAACVIAAFYFGHPVVACIIAFFGFSSVVFDP